MPILPHPTLYPHPSNVQSPGVTLSNNDKVAIARQLSRLGVDVCEAGFPIASEGDFAAVERIAKEIGPLTTGKIQRGSFNYEYKRTERGF